MTKAATTTKKITLKSDVQFMKKGHSYYYKGQRLLSVTKIIGIKDKPKLKQWAANEAADLIAGVWQPGKTYTEAEILSHITSARSAWYSRSKKAQDQGSIAHAWIDRHVRGVKLEMPADEGARNSVNSFLEWEASNDVKFLLSEQPIVDPVNLVAGMLDTLALVNSRVALLDYKSGSGVYPEHFMQSNVYAKIAEPLLLPKGTKIEDVYIVHIPKEGGMAEAIKVPTDREKDWKAFLGAKALLEWALEVGEA